MVRLLRAQTEKDGQIFGDGILEIIEDGFGFLRGQRFLPGPGRYLRLAVTNSPLRAADRRPR